MAVNNDYAAPSQNPRLSPQFLRELMKSCVSLTSGKSNNCGEISLTNGATSTTVKEPLCNLNSVILAGAITAHAAAVTGLYFTAGTGSFVIHHSNPGFTDATFRYVIIG